ncbi:MAG: hypothetical protein AAFQ84_01935 [Pseudomonadota bacterium]
MATAHDHDCDHDPAECAVCTLVAVSDELDTGLEPAEPVNPVQQISRYDQTIDLFCALVDVDGALALWPRAPPLTAVS